MATFQKQFLAAILKSLLRGKSLIQAILAYWTSSLAVPADARDPSTASSLRSTQDFLKEAEALLLDPVSQHGLQQMARDLRKQYAERLQTSTEAMLPSYNHQLPNGNERGHYLALDVGGSTLRVALVQLRGRMPKVGEESGIVSIRNFAITPTIKSLEGMAFFDWMASRIKETLAEQYEHLNNSEQPLLMSMAWSFPIE
jgi:hexokinase